MFEHPSRRSRSPNKIKTTGHSISCDILITSCNYNICHSLNCPKNLGKRTQTAKNTYNWLFLLLLSNLPCRFWSWKKTKAIMYASIKQTLLIFMKYSMICNWNCPRFWGNWPQRRKILTTYYFWYCLSTHSCQPRSQYKLKSTGHEITNDTHII